MAKKKTSGPLLPPIDVPLLEPAIDGDTEGGHGGMGLRHTERDLVVYMIAPAGGVDAGGVVSLFWGNRNVAVASTPIREGEENLARIPLTLPVGRIVEFWTGPVFGKLRRRSGNESFTEELNLRVRLNRPGGFDPDDDTEGHQRLVYVVPPEILFNGVSEAAALAGVRIIIRHWLHMGAYDLILLVWGSQRVEHRVQPGEVGRDITLTVDYATISAAGNNRLTRVAYQVRDAGGNLPDERARWSALSLIDVHLNEVRPEAPWLEFPKTGTVINLADLVSSDVLIQCWITSAEVAAYSQLTLIWAGTDSEGNSIPHIIARALNAPGVQTFEIPNALVAAIANGNASVHVLFQKGAIEQPSQKLYLDIVGELVRWPAPTIDEDLGGHIEPDVAATVRFPLQGSWPANGYLEVIFRASSPDNTIEHRVGREVDDIAPTPGGDMLFIVYPDELVRFDGHLVEVFYAHTRPGNRPQESQRLQVIVGQLQRTMPAPIIEKAISGQLNPDDIGTHAKVFAPFTQTKRADWIRMYWIGAHARTEVAVEVPVDGTTTEHSIESHYVTNNLNESVTVFYTLRRGDEPPRYSQITEVLISRGVGELPVPTLLEAQVTGPDTADLEPLKVESGTKLVVSYVGMRGTDSISIAMVGAADGGSPDIPAKPGNEALQKVEFDISKAAIHANIRNVATTVKFNYVVTRNSVPKTSGTLTVTVKPLALEELAKTILQINQADATTKILDLSAFTGAATIRVGVWPFITTPYPVWLRLLGRTAGNVAHDRLVYNGAGSAAVNVNWVSSGQIEATILRTYLDGLGHNSQLKMELKAAVSRSKVEAQAITFPMVTYTVNTLPAEFPVPKLTQATGSGTAVTLAPMRALNGDTVEVRFSPMYTTDSIKVTMVGTAGAGSPAIAAKPGVTAGVVTFDISKDAIAANIGNTNKTFTLKYEVTRAGVVRPSAILTVTVTPIPTSELAKTVIRINEANQTTKVLDLSSGTANRTLRAGTWPFITSSKPVWMELRGFKADGTAHNLQVWKGGSHQTNSTWVSQGWWEHAISYASYLKELGHNKKLTLHFKAALRAGITEADAIVFPVVEYTVNTLPAEFPVPKLTQATGSGTAVTLAPMRALNGDTVEVRFLPMYPTDSIKVTMVGTAGAGSPAIAAKPGVTAGVVTFDIPKDAIAANIGNTNKTFTLKYEVTRAGVVRPSAILTVTVTPIPTSELAKTVIRINEANQTTKVLDLSSGTANRTLRAGTWPFITSSKPVWMELRGFKADGTAHNLQVWKGGSHQTNSTWVSQGWWEYVISYASYLKELGNNRKLTLHFKAALRAGITEADAIVFPVVEYTVQGNYSYIDETNFNNQTLNGWAMPGIVKLYNFRPRDSGYYLWMEAEGSGKTTELLKIFNPGQIQGGTYELSFDYMGGPYGNAILIHIYNSDWTRSEFYWDASSSWVRRAFRFSVPAGRYIHHIALFLRLSTTLATFISLDNITIRRV